MPPSSATMASRRVGAGDAGMGSGGPNVEKDVVGSKQHASPPLPSSSVAPSSQMSVPDLLRHFGVSPDDGLSSDQVLERRERYGWNELTKEEGTPLYRLILDQFDDVLVKILLAAAVVSFALAFFDGGGDDGLMAYVEPMVILIILILNAIVGVWQESNAEAALEALKDLQPEHARVVRDGGHVSTVASRDLVPGDVVEVRVGDRVPADLRLLRLRTTTLRVDQAQLTGESQSVEKDVELLPPENDNGNNGGTRQDDDVIQAKTNMLFATTVVVGGMGRGLVVSTGMSTEIGTIQRSVQDASTEDDSTPLKKKLDEFGDWLSKVILVICALVWVINYKNFFDPIHGNVLRGCIYYFKIAVALAVAAIPEGLPTVITTCLALGTRKMAKRGAIVRKLPSVETLGCTSVICSDKTGTLTTNEMSCVEVVLPAAEAGGGGGIEAARVYEVEGITYSPVGTIDPEPRFLTAKEKSADGKSKTCQVSMLSYICSLCNSASLEYDDQRGTVQRVGEPTEASLKVLVEKIGLPDRDAHRDLVAEREVDPNGTVHRVNDYWSSRGTVYSTLEFSRDRKSMSVLVKYNDHVDAAAGRFHTWAHNQLLVKGAPESVLERCTKILLSNGAVVPLTDEARAAWLKEHVERMAGTRALRCLAVAYRACSGPLGAYDGTRDHPARRMLSGSASNFADLESDLVFVGLVGMLDPPRDEIAPMIEMCKTAGIRVIMITGDNKLTAEAIARKVGILDDPEDADETTIAMTEKASPPLRTKLPRSLTGAQFFGLPEDEQLRILSGTTGGLVFSRTEPKHKQQMVKLLKKRLGCVVAMTGDGVNDAPALKQADIGIAMGITGTEVAKEASDMVLSDDNFATIVSAVEEGRAIYDNMQAFIRYLISSNIGEVAAIFFTAALGLPEGLIPVQLLWVNLVTDGPPATALGFNPADSDIMKKPPRRADDSLITNWVFFRYMVVGIYVGVACVGAFAYWYMYHEDEHTLITWHQLTHWAQCHDWEDFRVADFDGLDLHTDPCKYFTEGKVTASTLSLSVLVTIEMLNALNALSEDGSLLTMPPWANPYLVIAMFVSFGMHFLILYVDVLATTFSVTPLDFKEWMIVLAFSVPVILIDEVLKLVGRRLHAQELDRRLAKSAKNVSLDVGKKNQ